MAGPVLIAYDGSDDARAALRRAGELLEPREALVMTVWESGAAVAGAAGAGMPGGVAADALATLDEAARSEAEEKAAEGAEQAREAGFEATAIAVPAERTLWSTILLEAERRNAAVIVVGSRGRAPIRAALLGSVSSAVISHARVPVLVAHAGEAADG